MGFFSSSKTVAKAIGKGAWKTGALAWKFAGLPAGKGMVWVVKRAAVDPTTNKIKDMSLVQNVAKVKERLARNQCAQCGKKKFSKRMDFCGGSCSQMAMENWSVVKQTKNVHVKQHDIDGLYHGCGCNRFNTYHNCDGLNGERI